MEHQAGAQDLLQHGYSKRFMHTCFLNCIHSTWLRIGSVCTTTTQCTDVGPFLYITVFQSASTVNRHD